MLKKRGIKEFARSLRSLANIYYWEDARSLRSLANGEPALRRTIGSIGSALPHFRECAEGARMRARRAGNEEGDRWMISVDQKVVRKKVDPVKRFSLLVIALPTEFGVIHWTQPLKKISLVKKYLWYKNTSLHSRTCGTLYRNIFIAS
jgi:hypothetical protein